MTEPDPDPQALPMLPPMPHRAVEAVAPVPWSIRLRESLGNALPLLLLALFAATTYWLIRNTPEAAVESAAREVRHEPDYEMQGFVVQHYTQAGPARGVMEGARVRHYPDTDEMLIDQVRLRWADEQGHLMHATADTAVAREEGRKVRLEGHARVWRDAVPGGSTDLEFTSERMDFDADAATVRSPVPVVLREGVNRVQAGRLYYDHDNGHLELDGGVHGVLPPRAAAAGRRP